MKRRDFLVGLLASTAVAPTVKVEAGPLVNSYLHTTPGGVPPSFVSATGYNGPNSNLNSWTPFTALDLSDCSIALFCFSSDAGTNPVVDGASTAGWTKYSHTGGGTSVTGALFYKIAPTSSETLVISTSPVNETFSGILVRAANAANLSATSTHTNTTASANADPPSHDAGAVRDHLWIAFGSWDDISAVAAPTAAPSGYGNLTTRTGFGVSSGIATKELNAQTEDPGAFTSASEQWVTYTIALYA